MKQTCFYEDLYSTTFYIACFITLFLITLFGTLISKFPSFSPYVMSVSTPLILDILLSRRSWD